MNSERRLIEKIARKVPCAIGVAGSGGSLSRPGANLLPGPLAGLRLGIGDDAAVFGFRDSAEWAISCDAFVEGVHFLGDMHPPDSVGFKSLVRAASDLVAMGANPRMFLLTLALPARRTGAWLDKFLQGMGRAARLLGMCLVGGDTTESSSVSISITVFGDVATGRAVSRSGARAGDIVYVSGRLGGAQLGWELLQRNATEATRGGKMRRLLQPHFYPELRVELGAWLAKHRVASAMMDISDGLSTDLARMGVASAVGARLSAECIPLVRTMAAQASLLKKLKLDLLQMALHGGEDYELLFTVSPRNVSRLRRAPGFADLTAIGEIERGKQVLLVDAGGHAKRLMPGGWDPFRKK